MTPRDLFRDVLEDIGYLGVSDVFQDEDANKALRRANRWLDSLALKPLTAYHMPRTVVPLPANVASLTIGVGGDIDMARPTRIERAGLIIDTSATPQTEVPIAVLTDQRRDRIRQKTMGSPLTRTVFFDKDWQAGLGNLELYPVPTVATTALVLYTLQALTQFADLMTDYTYPPGYELMLEANLCVQLAGAFGRPVTPEMAAAAAASSAAVKISNTRPVEAQIDPSVPGMGGRGFYDYRTDSTS